MSPDSDLTKKCRYCGKPIAEGASCMDCTITDLEMPEAWLASAQLTDVAAPSFLVNTQTTERAAVTFPKCKLGRDRTNQIVIDDGYCSRFHSWITYEDGHYYIEDLGSTNGTLLNGTPLTNRRPLINADRVRVGRTDFTFLLERPPAPATTLDQTDTLKID